MLTSKINWVPMVNKRRETPRNRQNLMVSPMVTRRGIATIGIIKTVLCQLVSKNMFAESVRATIRRSGVLEKKVISVMPPRPYFDHGTGSRAQTTGVADGKFHYLNSCVNNCPDCLVYVNSSPQDCVENCPNCIGLYNKCKGLHSSLENCESIDIDNHNGDDIQIISLVNEVLSNKLLDESYEFNNRSGEMKNVDRMNPYKQYIPVKVIPMLDHFPEFIPNVNCVGGFPSQMNAKAWMYELQFENDAWLNSYLLKGIKEGFDIVDCPDDVSPYESSNYRSVLTAPAGSFVDDLICKEVQEGKYVRTDVRPKCVHSLGVVPKVGGNGYRPITDCLQPLNESINNRMGGTAKDFSFVTVDYVQSLFSQDCFSARIDIASAYRSISVNPAHWNLQGIRWVVDGSECFLLDTRLCFG